MSTTGKLPLITVVMRDADEFIATVRRFNTIAGASVFAYHNDRASTVTCYWFRYSPSHVFALAYAPIEERYADLDKIVAHFKAEDRYIRGAITITT